MAGPPFFDTAERALNLESPGSLWSNFGYWKQAGTYPQACEDLARFLADRVGLQASHQMLDLGFGMGEQLRLWAQAYGVHRLVGLNPALEQLKLAQQLDLPADYVLYELGAESSLMVVEPSSCDVVLALDCAYHFEQREQVWGQLAQVLKTDGQFVWTDLFVPDHADAGWQSMARLAMGKLSRIPHVNLLRKRDYEVQLDKAGLQLLHFEDISTWVFSPFSCWWRRYRKQFDLSRRRHLKFELVAQALGRLATTQTLGYGVFIARRAN